MPNDLLEQYRRNQAGNDDPIDIVDAFELNEDLFHKRIPGEEHLNFLEDDDIVYADIMAQGPKATAEWIKSRAKLKRWE